MSVVHHVALLLVVSASTASAGRSSTVHVDRAAAKLRAMRSDFRAMRSNRFSLGNDGRTERSSPRQPSSAANATAAYALLRRDFMFFERFVTLIIRSASRAVVAFRDWLGRSIGYPPRVMVVTLQGVIAADDEMRGARALLAADVDDLLVLDDDESSSGWRDYHRPRARGRPGGSALINLERCERQLERAFSAHGTRAVCLVINSPGGSPVQSSLIYERLRALRKRYKRVPLLAFVEDSAVSGGYYIACAADEIIADPSSMVGSVGVISRGFGYVKAIKRQGVSRRVHTAGASKGGVDPYLPQRRKDLAAQVSDCSPTVPRAAADAAAQRSLRSRPKSQQPRRMHPGLQQPTALVPTLMPAPSRTGSPIWTPERRASPSEPLSCPAEPPLPRRRAFSRRSTPTSSERSRPGAATGCDPRRPRASTTRPRAGALAGGAPRRARARSPSSSSRALASSMAPSTRARWARALAEGPPRDASACPPDEAVLAPGLSLC